MSETKTRRVAAIGNGRVIPAKAGIQRLWERGSSVLRRTMLGSRVRGNDGR